MVGVSRTQSSVGELGNYLSYGSVGDEKIGWKAGRNVGPDPSMEQAMDRMKKTGVERIIEGEK